jgi:demethylmenaquinone methyltransferase/2-methoxy-6-polyprenyl-1,4-benzoquinol methylase
MFTRVAPRYDLLNRVLSLQTDRVWRWRVARMLQGELRSGALVLDLCCGTGDLLRALERAGEARVVGADFCHPMLVRTGEKSQAPLVEADGLRLPVGDGTFNLVTVAFGFRNFANYRKGLEEMLRVLKPGGRAVILEFTTPPFAVTRWLLSQWNRWVMGPVGKWISGQGDAYSYLPESVARFPGAKELEGMMREAGFVETGFRYLDVGIVAVHWGRRVGEAQASGLTKIGGAG